MRKRDLAYNEKLEAYEAFARDHGYHTERIENLIVDAHSVQEAFPREGNENDPDAWKHQGGAWGMEGDNVVRTNEAALCKHEKTWNYVLRERLKETLTDRHPLLVRAWIGSMDLHAQGPGGGRNWDHTGGNSILKHVERTFLDAARAAVRKRPRGGGHVQQGQAPLVNVPCDWTDGQWLAAREPPFDGGKHENLKNMHVCPQAKKRLDAYLEMNDDYKFD